MAKTFYHRSTTVSTIAHGAVTHEVEHSLTQGSSATTLISANHADGADTEAFQFTTVADEPNSADWVSGDYQCVIDVTAAGADMTYGLLTLGGSAGHFARLNSIATTHLETQAQQESAFSGTGLKTATTGTWDPASGAAGDRFECLIAARRTVTGGHGNQSVTIEVDDPGADPGRSIWDGEAAGQTVVVGTLAGSDSLLSVSGLKVASIGQIVELDASVAVQAEKFSVIGMVAEGETLVGITGGKGVPVGQITELDTLNAVALLQLFAELQLSGFRIDLTYEEAGGQTIAIGTIVEADFLTAVGARKLAGVGLISGADTLVAVQAVKLMSVGTLVGVDSLITIPARKDAAIGLIPEADSLAVIQAVKPIIQPVGTVNGVDLLFGVGARKLAGVGLIAGVDSLVPVQAVKPIIRLVGLLAGSDTLVSIQGIKLVPVGLVSEVGDLVTVQAVKPILFPIGVTTELDVLNLVSGFKTASPGTLSETEILLDIQAEVGGEQTINVGAVAALEALVTVLADKPIIQTVGLLAEADGLVAVSGRKTVDISPLLQSEVLVDVEALKPIVRAVGVFSEVEQLLQIPRIKGINISPLVEADSFIDVARVKHAPVSPLMENNLLLDVEAVKPTVNAVGTLITAETLLAITFILGEPVILYMRVVTRGKPTNVSSREYDATQEATVEGN